MSFIAAAIIGGSVIGAGASIYGANQAADVSKRGTDQAIDEQRWQYNIGLSMLEPQRGLGYGAMQDLASLYGYALPGYTPLNQLGMGGPGGSGTIDVRGRRRGNREIAGISVNPLNRGSHSWGGTIDPLTGMVDVANGNENKDEFLTNYLRTGEWEGGVGRYRDLKDQIDKLRAGGWTWDPEKNQSNYAAQQAGTGTVGQPAQAGNMSRFFTSPDYQFRMDEGMDAIKNLASVRGGVGGNVLREGANVASGLASGEFNNYVSRLMQLAGFGASATQQGVNAATQQGVNVGTLYAQQGNARASSYLTGAAGVNSSIQGGLQNWTFQNYLNNQGGQGGAGGSPYGWVSPFDQTPPNFTVRPGG